MITEYLNFLTTSIFNGFASLIHLVPYAFLGVEYLISTIELFSTYIILLILFIEAVIVTAANSNSRETLEFITKVAEYNYIILAVVFGLIWKIITAILKVVEIFAGKLFGLLSLV